VLRAQSLRAPTVLAVQSALPTDFGPILNELVFYDLPSGNTVTPAGTSTNSNNMAPVGAHTHTDTHTLTLKHTHTHTHTQAHTLTHTYTHTHTHRWGLLSAP
jgi:hypothetical protein